MACSRRGTKLVVIKTTPDSAKQRAMRSRSVEIDSVWDDNWYQKSLKALISTDHRDYEINGEIESLIPLRNQRSTPDGEQLLTRITEGLTRYECDGMTGWGMSEYLDQIVDGIPIGAV